MEIRVEHGGDVQPKWLKLVVKVMRGELTTWEVLLEQLELLRELWDL